MTSRRQFIASLAALMSAPALARAASLNHEGTIRLAATWQAGNGYQTGVLSGETSTNALSIVSAIDVPTRAHGLLLEPAGTIITVARRPGNWLLRWDHNGKPLAWHWSEPGRVFAGHLLASADGRTLYTTEINLETGDGLIGVRDAASLEKRDEWLTHGIDPHQLVWDVTHPGSLIVANGGVPTRPETGRIKLDLGQMDSSLVRLDAKTGELQGQWRLQDRRLSLRHLAWNVSVPGQPVLGIALQAEHDTEIEKVASPVLALFDGRALHAVPATQPLAGYGGSIAPIENGFAIGCPRAQGIAIYGSNGFQELIYLAEACPLATDMGELLAGGSQMALGVKPAQASAVAEMEIPRIRLDNHWIVIN
jgi:hypothetical protein